MSTPGALRWPCGLPCLGGWRLSLVRALQAAAATYLGSLERSSPVPPRASSSCSSADTCCSSSSPHPQLPGHHPLKVRR